MSVLYCFGSNGSYQLGLDHDEDLNVPVVTFKADENISKVACGGNHTLLLLESGKVFASGDNSQGQCCVEYEGPLKGWYQVPGVYKDVSCGWEYSHLITTTGECFASGYGGKGELGLKGVKRAIMKKVPLPSCSEIKSGFQHVLCKTSQGVFGWGPNRKLQLGGPVEKIVDTPRFVGQYSHFELGKDFSVVFDSNTHILSQRDELLKPIGDFHTMWSSVHYKTQNTIVSVGNNSDGQILEAPIPDGEITKWATGSEHGILVLDDNSVWCWGWGEHGNCGNQTNPLTKVYDGPVKAVFGGCATTWIVT